MSLARYKRKRDFSKTPEPRARVKRRNRRPIFVVQEHHASRLHYDFRIEAEGVLKSWAVPRKPTLDTSAKRLAVHVEDHPLEYASFSGEIPRGEYGAGTVKIWDSGTYENLLEHKPHPQSIAAGLKKGHLEIKLSGNKLKGGFALVRMDRRGSKDNWLLIKMKDNGRTPPRKSRKGASPPHPKRRVNAVKLTNLDKILFPEARLSKADVVEFYRRIADRLLPHLRDRPMTLERLPDGLAKRTATHFWQKNTPDYYPSWIPRISIKSESGDRIDYVLVNDVATLEFLVNQGTITFHPWLSRIADLDRPDFVLFDLDPGEASFADAVVVAREVRRLLDEEGVRCFLKTSGKTGLHVLAPWQGGGFYEARKWALERANQIVAALPEKATVERSKSGRRGRVYVDVLQNVRGHHAVPPYVLRPTPQATLSTPLRWDELSPRLDPARFNLKTIFRRLAQQKSDPLADLVALFTKD